MSHVFEQLQAALADRYHLEREAGSGGMATVYVARDLRHDRLVAVKVLKHDLARALGAERFLQEVRLSAQLEHPHILTLIDSGEADGFLYYVMPYIEGPSLREKLRQGGELPVDEAVHILQEIADALSYAHGKGIVHRDVKPDNILFSGGHVVVTDFGIAKAVTNAARDEAAITTAGSALGTPAYMAPEQAAADPHIDHRADIYALGCVAYELLTGKPPFTGSTAQQVLSAQVTQSPDAPTKYRATIPDDLEAVVMRCLEKRAADRWQAATEFQSRLRTTLSTTPVTGSIPITAPRRRMRQGLVGGALAAVAAIGWWMLGSGGGVAGETDVPSVAVLPFVDMSPGGDQAYFGDGIAEEILSALTKLQNLRVASRTSTFKLRDAELADISRQLDVGHVLEGSVRQQGETVRVTARLTAVADGSNLWSQTFDGPLTDVFGIQEDISQAVVGALRVQLLGTEGVTLTARGTENIEAYNRYLQGRFQWNQRTDVSLHAAIESFQDAARIDPDYARAYVGLADAYIVLGGQGLGRPIEVFPPAKAAVNRALELNPDLPEAHRGLGMIRFLYDYDWAGSEREFQRALELAPNDAFARYWYSLLLDALGRFDEGEAHVLRARELDPVAMQIATGVAQHYQFTGDFGRSIDEFRRVTETDPTYPPAWSTGAQVLLNDGQASTALEWVEESERLGRPARIIRARILQALGREAEARALIEETLASRDSVWVPAAEVPVYYAEAGDLDRAVQWMETAIAERNNILQAVTRANTNRALWSDPRFVRLLQQVGLEAAPER